MFPTLWIKICGNTSLEDAQLAADAGADAVGFVFAPSPRRVTLAQVAAIVPQLPAKLEKIGVFVDASFEEIAATVEACGLSGVQLHFNAAPSLSAQLRQRFGPALRILRVVHFDAFQPAEELNPTQTQKGFVSGHDLSRLSTGLRPTQGDENPADPPGKSLPEGAVENSPGQVRLGGRSPGKDGWKSMSPVGATELPKVVFDRAERASKTTWASAPAGCFSDPNVDADAILVDSRSPQAVGGTGQPFDWATASKTLFQDAKARDYRLIAAGGLTPKNVAEAIATLRPWGIDAVSGVEAAPGRKDPAKVRALIAHARAAAGE